MATQQQNHGLQVGFTPRFLVTSPHVQGTAYDRQVVYVLEHNEQRAVALLLDEKFQTALRELRNVLSEASVLRKPLPQHVASLPVTVITWAAGQLDTELRYGVWLSGPSDFERVFGEYDDLWVELVRHIGHTILRDALHIQHLNAQPWLN